MSHLREHKFKHNFHDCLNPICSCGLDIESTSHFLLHCPSFNDERYTLLSTLHKIDCKLLELTKSSLSQTLLYGNSLFDTHSFLTQQLNIFYPLKDSKSFLFSKFPLESLNPSRSFPKCLAIFTSYFLSHSVIYIYIYIYIYFYFCLFPGILEFWCLVTVTFRFTVLYNNIIEKKNTLCDQRLIFLEIGGWVERQKNW